MTVTDAINQRKSIREFTDRKLTKSEIETLLAAAVRAPSACNMQSWFFYVVVDPKEREKFKDICAEWISTAPVVFIVCTDDAGIVSRFGERGRKFPMQDTSLAIENLLLKATEMGLGGCVIGAYKQQECHEAFNIPESRKVVALLPIGEPKNDTPVRERKPLAEVISYIGELPPDDSQYLKDGNTAQLFELKHQCLASAEFEDLSLPNAKFNNINLSGAKFADVNLSGAEYSDINLSESKYSALNMTGADFKCVELNEAKFGCCEKCEQEGKYCVEMKKAVFDSVDMTQSQLNHCNLVNSVLTDISMAGAKMYDVDLDAGDLSGVNMVEAKLRCVNLYGSEIKNSCFENAHFESCDITGMTIDGIEILPLIEAYKKENSK